MTLPVFAFGPNWGQDSFKVTREFKTDIITSRAGKEQRRATRSTARKTVAYPSMRAGADKRHFDMMLARYSDQQGLLADYTTSALVVADIAANASAATIEEVPDWLYDGANVIFGDGAVSEALVVQSIVGQVVTFTSAVVNPWPANSVFHLAWTGRFDPSMDADQLTDSVINANIKFNVLPTSERIDDGAATLTFNGREVFTAERNWAESSQPSYQGSYDSVDSGFGPVAYYNPVAFRTRVQQVVYTGKTWAEARQIEQLFERMKGRRGEFYMPTWQNDLPLKLPTNGSIRVDGRLTYDLMKDDTVFKAIMIVLKDGTLIPMLVSSLTLVTDGSGTNDTLVNLTGPIGRTITPNVVRCVSWMPVWRFATDSLTTEWLTDQVAQIQVNHQTVESLPAE